MKSLKKNYFYNLIYNMANIMFPFITAPYLSKVLGAENIGKVNYATSIITWFILFAAFGIPRFGIREIAKNRDNKKKLSLVFWNLIIIQTILSLVFIIIYLVLIFKLPSLQQERELYLLMVFMLILNIFSIDWFYEGIENYKYVGIRNTVFKAISIMLIFLMIKEKDDYIFYSLINIFALSFNNILNYINAQKYIDKKIYEFKILYYLKKLKVYFLMTLIVAIYSQFDQIFLGNVSNIDLAYYLRSKMILGGGFSIINSIIVIFIPRTVYLAKNNYEEYKKVLEKSINYIYLFALPCTIGIFMLSEDIMIFLGGQEFIQAKYSLRIICWLCLVTSIGAWQINQILLVNGKEKLVFKIQLVVAIFSIILNSILIPQYTHIGAAITWTASQIILAILEAIFIRKEIKTLKIKYLTSSFIKYLLAVVMMGISIVIIKMFITNYILVIGVSLVAAPIIYFGMIIILKDKIVLDGINQVLKKKKII